MYSWKEIKNGLSQPRKIVRELNRMYDTRIKSNEAQPINIFDEDWDNLLILDACRFDLLEEYLETEIDHRWSGGSNSIEFLEHNIGSRKAPDTVWVTANPHVSKFGDNIFEIRELWNTYWDSELATVPPEAVVKEAIKAEQAHPDKKIIAHFMQPHYPFIGDKGRSQLPRQGSFTGDGVLAVEPDDDNIWMMMRNGELSEEVAYEGYKENLELVWPHAERLIDGLTGKTIVTSDHGNVFGKSIGPIPMRLYGHPYGFQIEELIRVPWIESPSENRKTIREGEISGLNSENEEKRDERLRQLGYLN